MNGMAVRCGSDIPSASLNDADGTARLLERIQAFQLDDPEARFPFTSRLAKEQGWSHAKAGRVVAEYKRFVALAMVAGHPVSPPEAIDQVWHLHLVYTKSYWHDLCRDLLGTELHHFPTTGGEEEGAKFGDWYARTLESYRKIFGAKPPKDIWPSARRRKKETVGEGGRWMYPSKHLLIRFPAWLRPWRWFLPSKKP